MNEFRERAFLWLFRGSRKEEFRRASGDCICECGKKYIQHPLGGPDGYDGKFLNQLCNGDLVKL